MHTVEATIKVGKYSFAKGKVVLDKETISGKVKIDERALSGQTRDLEIQKLDVSKDLKSVSFYAKIAKTKSDVVSGTLVFARPIGFEDGDDQSSPAGKNKLSVKIGKASLDAKKTAAGSIHFGT